MWVRSTGLGKRNELVAKFEGIRQEGDCWVLSIKTVEPVKWHIRVAMTAQDLRQMVGVMAKDGSLLRLPLSVLKRNHVQRPPSDF